MTSTTTNLGLTLYNNTTDQSGSFITWQRDMSGSGNSNMRKIDNWSGSASGSITALSGSVSGSVNVINATISSISGSIATINSNILTLDTKFKLLASFNSTGTANFDNISGSYTNLLIIGVAAGNRTATNIDVGIDFNGDANSANYGAIQWIRTSAEFLTPYSLIGAIVLGNIPTSSNPGYGGPFIAIVPNYSASSGFYKTAMGISAYATNTPYGASLQGGYWKSTSAITRIRVFAIASGTGSTRYGFLSGTKISLYGFG